MWLKLRKQLAVEREQLGRLIETHRPLLLKCVDSRPDPIELSALAAMLHAFYSGIENMFKRVKVELRETLPDAKAWHRQLLIDMTSSGPDRPPVISTELSEILQGYLEFRHVFRQAYPFQLSWPKMADLVNQCEDTLRRLEKEIDEFLEATQERA